MRRWLLAATFLGAVLGAQETETVRARIVYATGGGYYIDAGTARGLAKGLTGTVRRGAQAVAEVVIRSLSSTSAFVEVTRRFGPEGPRVGDRIVFTVPRRRAALQPRRERPFRPLLEPAPRPARSRTKNVFHGSFRVGANVVHNRELNRSYRYYRAAADGNGERLGGEPWSLGWRLDLNLRDGSGYEDHPDFRELKLRVDELVVRRHFGPEAVVAAGRLVPLALPALGPWDGVQGELLVGGVRWGLVAGFLPDRDDLGFHARECGLAAYGAFTVGAGEATEWQGAVGILATWFDGTADRHACLWDSRLTHQGRLALSISGELDYYTGTEPVRSGLGLTRLNGELTWEAAGWLDLWLGSLRYELPDTEAERALVRVRERFDRGYRRTYLGARERVGRGWTLDQEVSVTTAAATGDDTQVRLGIAQTDLFVSGAYFQVSAWNLFGLDLAGKGGEAAYSVPLAERLYVRVGWLFSRAEQDQAGAPTLTNHVLSLDLDWRPARAWALAVRLSQGFGDATAFTALDFFVTVHW